MMIKTFTLKDIENIDDLKSNLSSLAENVNKIGKEISYLDLYNITTAIENKEDFQKEVNFLAPNSAAVINAPSFSIDNITYKTGDIMLRNNAGDLIHIKAQAGGVYFPAQILKDKDGQYQIIFQYSEAIISGNIEKPVAENNNENIVDKAYQKISFTGLQTSNEDATIYGHIFAIDSSNQAFSFSAMTIGSTVVRPVIKFYFEDDTGDREEVFLDYAVELSQGENPEFTVTINDTFTGVGVVK